MAVSAAVVLALAWCWLGEKVYVAMQRVQYRQLVDTYHMPHLPAAQRRPALRKATDKGKGKGKDKSSDGKPRDKSKGPARAVGAAPP
eukprot:3900217-Pyramimonas_sp.AAC.1